MGQAKQDIASLEPERPNRPKATWHRHSNYPILRMEHARKFTKGILKNNNWALARGPSPRNQKRSTPELHKHQSDQDASIGRVLFHGSHLTRAAQERSSNFSLKSKGHRQLKALPDSEIDTSAPHCRSRPLGDRHSSHRPCVVTRQPRAIQSTW